MVSWRSERACRKVCSPFRRDSKAITKSAQGVKTSPTRMIIASLAFIHVQHSRHHDKIMLKIHTQKEYTVVVVAAVTVFVGARF